MQGIDLDGTVEYIYSSMRQFKKNERHINRVCNSEVLILMLDGELCFSEDGVEYCLKKGDYHIQRGGSRQFGNVPSDSPRYFYVHFNGAWRTDGIKSLAKWGRFDPASLEVCINRLENACRDDATYLEKKAAFYEILVSLCRCDDDSNPAVRIAKYIRENIKKEISLSELSAVFHFSPNHIINIFRNYYNCTPIEYRNCLRIKKAAMTMEESSVTLSEAAYKWGFSDYSCFYKLFVKMYGISPAKWRKRRMNELANIAEMNNSI